MYRSIFFFLVLLLSCTEEKVSLPVIPNKGITEVYNTSNIWFFFKTHKGDTTASVNSRNKIANTHLIFHIDKKLQLKHILPDLVAIQNKLQEKSMHKKEGMKNYFSYADPAHKTYALVDFTDTRYFMENAASLPDSAGNNTLDICDGRFVLRNNTYPLPELEVELKELVADSVNTGPLALRFCETLTYDQYLHTKSLLQLLKVTTVDTEIIYSKK